MESPGGGLFFDVMGVFKPDVNGPSGLSPPLSVAFEDFCSRDSINCLCLSLTEMLLCSCSNMLGSCV
jgi:hypothetical protein